MMTTGATRLRRARLWFGVAAVATSVIAFSIHNRIIEDVYDNLMAFASG